MWRKPAQVRMCQGLELGRQGSPGPPLARQFPRPCLGRVDLSPVPLQGRSVLPIPGELIDPHHVALDGLYPSWAFAIPFPVLHSPHPL